MLSRKELFKNTLRKAAHAWKRIIELRLSGITSSGFIMNLLFIALRVNVLILSLLISEQEAYWLRFFVDQPAFTDLHWVILFLVLMACFVILFRALDF